MGYFGYFAFACGRPGCPIPSARLLVPRRPAAGGAPSSWLDARLSKLALMFTAQSFVKHLLTEGDKIVLSFAASLYDQGVYALAQNYGSLVARLALGPLEESARVLFSKMGAAIAAADAAAWRAHHAV